MRQARRIKISAICGACAVAFLLASGAVVAQNYNNDRGHDHDKDKMPPRYNPYPPGILPPDLVSEQQRVRREIRGIEAEAVTESLTLGPVTYTGQPPKIQGNGYEAVRTLGKLMNYDEKISAFGDVACASCHMPYAGFSGPIQSVNLTMSAYPGSYDFRAGKRNPQRYTYSPDFPVLEYNTTQGLFFGGNFWDSRATGYQLQSPDAEQSQGPPVDTQEHMLPDTACIVYHLSKAVYRPLFEQIWGADSFDIHWPGNTEEICETPGGASIFGGSATPIRLSPEDRTRSNNDYDHWAQSISFFERGDDVSPFTSKFDAYLKGTATLTADELAGYNLFRGKGNCNSCHLDGRSTAPTPPPPQGEAPNGSDTGAEADTRPLFTCFGSANEGLPLNPRDPIYYQNTPDFFGFTANPFGFGFRDLGMGTFLRSGPGSWPNPNATWTQYAPTSDGTMQVSTARNVAMTPTQCPTTEAPGPYFQKEFFHNGYIKSLKQLVHFYNTRDKPDFVFDVTSGHCPSGTVEKVNCWPRPEVKNNLDMTTGNLGLTDQEEDQIVAFLQTLTDGYTKPYPNRDKFTGACMTCNPAIDPNCSPSRQGNASLIPTPPLPPCASAICDVAPLPTTPIP
jgi:cytochrome c peroxidase